MSDPAGKYPEKLDLRTFLNTCFSEDENVPTGTFDKIIEGVGGNNNGFTSRDITAYFEMFPRNALEKVLW
jgi:zinc protease